MGLVVTVTPNAALDHTRYADELRPGRRHRVRHEHAQAGGERGHASAAPLPAKLRRALFAVSLCSTLLAPLCAIPAHAAESDAHASTASTSRWWKLECGDASRQRAAEPTACTFTVKLRGGIDGSRLHLVQQALERRDAARRALRREVELQSVPPDRVRRLCAADLAGYGIGAVDPLVLEERRRVAIRR